MPGPPDPSALSWRVRLTNQPGPCAGRLAFVAARDAQTARLALAGVCLVGRITPTLLPGGRGPRRIAPASGAGRSTVCLARSLGGAGR